MGYAQLFPIKRLWIIFGLAMAFSFAVLLGFGNLIYQQAPPIARVVSEAHGEVIHTREEILRGQQVWRTLGGMQLGSVWGHGGYLAPDWTADWLHREASALADIVAQREYGARLDDLNELQRAYVTAAVRVEMRTNTHDPSDNSITVSAERARAMATVGAHYYGLFGGDTAPYLKLRKQMAIAANVRLPAEQARALSAFFFWTSWGASTNRPGQEITYTSNWPHEKLVGNTPTAPVFLWSLASIVLLLGGIGALCWYYVRQYDAWRDDLVPQFGVAKSDFFAEIKLTPSMRATLKYFATVIALIVVQITLGAITAHYAVDGREFYGLPISDYLPYAVTRTWHVQAALFWIATAWLAAGLFLAPLISGHEPKLQRIGVNFLYCCLLIIVVGSFAGEWLGVQRRFDSFTANFWFGHQGYEYLDLGRFWQIFLFIGLLLWLVMMFRALWPALRGEGGNRHLIWMLLISSIAIGLLYGAGLLWGQNTHLSVAEYWRWWVVHLWVEGVFEVFATAIIAFLFVKMGLLRASTASISVLFAALIFLSGGVLGTFHHLYWSGTPIGVLAIGGMFSALEVVPLVIIGFEAYTHYKVEREASSWIGRYHWPLMFLLAVSFWNLVGAGLLGFLINPPLALYYLQGLNTTPVHGHAALFGVYGMLAIGLSLFCLCLSSDRALWKNRTLKVSFWAFNIGLGAMVFLSLLPQGILQAMESYSVGYWSARAPQFMHQPIMEFFVWMRVPGDIIFTVGALALAWFGWQLWRGSTSSDKAMAKRP